MALLTLLSACQMGYYLKGAYNQFSMMSKRQPIENVLKDPSLATDVRAKLEAAVAAHDFAIKTIGLKETENYTTFVQLDRPYASWVVNAAPRWRLEHHEWKYPIVGSLPYKGFYTEDEAKAEQDSLEREDFDTSMRGVSAYSTLGWFKDSVLSSMLKSSEHDLVNTIIHETTHTTLYIKSSADFNERLAVFVGNKGAEQFYIAREGADSPTVKTIAEENADDRLFSDFIGPQLKDLKAWYEALPEADRKEDTRQQRFKDLQAAFTRDVLPKMKTRSYARFPEMKLNNARLMLYRTYTQDLKDFEELYRLTGTWARFLACAKTLEKADKPEDALKDLNRKLADSAGPNGVCGSP